MIIIGVAALDRNRAEGYEKVIKSRGQKLCRFSSRRLP